MEFEEFLSWYESKRQIVERNFELRYDELNTGANQIGYYYDKITNDYVVYYNDGANSVRFSVESLNSVYKNLRLFVKLILNQPQYNGG